MDHETEVETDTTVRLHLQLPPPHEQENKGPNFPSWLLSSFPFTLKDVLQAYRKQPTALFPPNVYACMCVTMCHSTHADRGQLSRVSCLLLLCGPRRLNSGRSGLVAGTLTPRAISLTYKPVFLTMCTCAHAAPWQSPTRGPHKPSLGRKAQCPL